VSLMSIIVIGGANLDIKSVIAGKTVAATSNPGASALSLGGVGRNIAENLARLGAPVALLSVVGDDDAGARLIAGSAAAGIDMRLTARAKGNTGTYAVVIDRQGEMVIGVADMRLIDAITPRFIARHKAELAAARLLVADCNLSAEALAEVARIAARANIPLIIEPVSVPKAKRLASLLRAGLPIHAVTPNRDELAALVGFPVRSEAALKRAMRLLHRRGVRHVLVGLGAAGCYLSSAHDDINFTVHLPAASRTKVRDVTGGGDAMVAGFAYGLARGKTAAQAARMGQELAARAVHSLTSVAAPKAAGGKARSRS
jgi:pseudouridine kinase